MEQQKGQPRATEAEECRDSPVEKGSCSTRRDNDRPAQTGAGENARRARRDGVLRQFVRAGRSVIVRLARVCKSRAHPPSPRLRRTRRSAKHLLLPCRSAGIVDHAINIVGEPGQIRLHSGKAVVLESGKRFAEEPASVSPKNT
jgi:hypothetical protein